MFDRGFLLKGKVQYSLFKYLSLINYGLLKVLAQISFDSCPLCKYSVVENYDVCHSTDYMICFLSPPKFELWFQLFYTPAY